MTAGCRMRKRRLPLRVWMQRLVLIEVKLTLENDVNIGLEDQYQGRELRIPPSNGLEVENEKEKSMADRQNESNCSFNVSM